MCNGNNRRRRNKGTEEIFEDTKPQIKQAWRTPGGKNINFVPRQLH